MSQQLDLASLRTWFERNGLAVDGPLSSRVISGGRSNPTYEIVDGVRSWILRRPPYGHVLPTAHDMGREYRVMRALQGTAVPVPRMVELCQDDTVIGASFYLMDKLDGLTLRTPRDTGLLSEGERRSLASRMVSTLVDLHEIDPGEVGLDGWGKPDGYLARQLLRWRQQWDSSMTRPRAEIDELSTRLKRALPETRHPGIVHGDFKIDNMMVGREDPTHIIGVLDWEMSTTGDTLTDLGILCSFWDEPGEFFNPITAGATALPGFPTRAEIVEQYAGARSIDVDQLNWYIAFADFKIAVILEGIHARHLLGHSADGSPSDVGDMVDPLLHRSLQRAEQL